MRQRAFFLGIFTISVLLIWGIGYVLIELFYEKETTLVSLNPTITPTQRPIREDVPEIRAGEPTPTTPPTFTPPPGTPTLDVTATPAFTLEALEIDPFDGQPERLPTLEATPEANVPPGGAYPIQIAIPEANINAAVLVVGDDFNIDIITPREEAGYYVRTPKIGAGGNTVMVGHVYPGRVFNNLLEVQIGQVVRVTDENYVDHYYQIQEIVRFPYESGTQADRELGFSYVFENTVERLTLVTCYPEYEWTHRFVVRAIPIPKPE